MSSSTPILTRFDRTARLAFLRSDWRRKPVVCIGALREQKEHRASSTTSKEKHGFSSSSPDCAAARCRNSFIPAFYTCSKWRPQNLSGSSRSNDCNDHEPDGNLRSDARKAVPDPGTPFCPPSRVAHVRCFGVVRVTYKNRRLISGR